MARYGRDYRGGGWLSWGGVDEGWGGAFGHGHRRDYDVGRYRDDQRAREGHRGPRGGGYGGGYGQDYRGGNAYGRDYRSAGGYDTHTFRGGGYDRGFRGRSGGFPGGYDRDDYRRGLGGGRDMDHWRRGGGFLDRLWGGWGRGSGGRPGGGGW